MSSKMNRKVLVPLATMLVAGAVAVGSGATFTSQSAHAVSVTAGTLHHANTNNGQTLTIAKIKPGDTKTGTLTITNDGNIDGFATDAFTCAVSDLGVVFGPHVIDNLKKIIQFPTDTTGAHAAVADINFFR